MTKGFFKRLAAVLSLIGPGIFAIGYTIGTGSVTSMAKAGADYGLGLVWMLALSCLFSGVLMTAYGRFAAVTGETTLHGIARFLPGGKWIAAFLFLGVVTAQYKGRPRASWGRVRATPFWTSLVRRPSRE